LLQFKSKKMFFFDKQNQNFKSSSLPFFSNCYYLIASFHSDVEELDLSYVFSASSEESEPTEQDVGVGHEPDRFDGVTGIAPSTAVRIKSVFIRTISITLETG
jgi:hypothetical protein